MTDNKYLGVLALAGAVGVGFYLYRKYQDSKEVSPTETAPTYFVPGSTSTASTRTSAPDPSKTEPTKPEPKKRTSGSKSKSKSTARFVTGVDIDKPVAKTSVDTRFLQNPSGGILDLSAKQSISVSEATKRYSQDKPSIFAYGVSRA